MEIIRERDIDFNTLTKVNCRINSESRLFHDKEVLYKMYKKTEFRVLRRKEKKIKLLNDGNKFDSVIVPDKIVIGSSLMSGCGMNYINDATNLFNFAKICNDINTFLELVYQISLTLREIHSDPREIVVGDLSFNNIIFDKNMKHYFVDFDSCKIDKMSADMIPFLLDSYTKVRGIYRYDIDANTDRLCLILCTLYTIFCKKIDSMTLYEFDSKTEGITALRNMREIIIQIKKYGKIPSVPYIDELIPNSKVKVRGIIRSR